MSEHKTLESFLLRDRLTDFDITADIRSALRDKGASFEGVSWADTETVVEAAIKPLRDEIIRLRAIIDTSSHIVPVKCSCVPEYSHLCWKCGGTGYLKQ